MIELVQSLGHGLIAWVPAMNLSAAFVLAGALLANHPLRRGVAASLRMLPFFLVLARVALPAGWSSPLGLLGRRAAGSTGLVTEGLPVFGTTGAVTPQLGAAFWAGVAYIAVAVLLMGAWLVARARLTNQLRMARPLPIPSQGGVGVEEHPTLGPLVAGFWRPRIVVPTTLARQTEPGVLACVLAHEAAHVARRDHLVAAAVQLACIVAWPVLPVWVAARQLRMLMELACDERATAGRPAEQRRHYGEVLFALAEGRPPLRGHALVPSFGSDLRTRVRALGRQRRWAGPVQAGLVVGLCGVLVACSAAPEDPAPRAASQTAPGRPKLADVIPGQASVNGGLDKEIIRRIVRRHINEVKFCYEAALPSNPRLSGRLMVQMTISGTGQVMSSQMQSSTLGNATVESCVLTAVRGWQFPKPMGGGIVIVTYPFVLAPTGPDVGAATGPYSKVVVREVAARKSAVTECYQQALKADAKSPRRIDVSWTIDPAGTVSGVKLEGTGGGAPQLGACVLDQIERWRFPPPPDGQPVTFSFPLLFQSTEAGQ